MIIGSELDGWNIIARGGMRILYEILFENSKGKRPLLETR